MLCFMRRGARGGQPGCASAHHQRTCVVACVYVAPSIFGRSNLALLSALPFFVSASITTCRRSAMCEVDGRARPFHQRGS
eukprot:6195322-Pleurochrysis_carterae.AAC.1